MSDKFSISPTEIVKLDHETSSRTPDFVSVEEPLEIQLLWGEQESPKPISVTMRTPGDDVALAAGFLYTEGIIRGGSDIQSTHAHTDPNGNQLCIQIDPRIPLDLSKLERHFYTTSSCGVCGKASLDAVQQQCWVELPKTQWKVSPSTLYTLPDSLRNLQSNFQQTGGIHGCALFDLQGNLIHAAEDVGRHNALDKLIGHFLLSAQSELGSRPTTHDELNTHLLTNSELSDIPFINHPTESSAQSELYTRVKKSSSQEFTFGEQTTQPNPSAVKHPCIPLSEHVLLLSGRISFELVQKAAMAGIRFIAAVGAPSSLAIDLAEEMGITLVGFLRGERGNIYTHPHRVGIVNH